MTAHSIHSSLYYCSTTDDRIIKIYCQTHHQIQNQSKCIVDNQDQDPPAAQQRQSKRRVPPKTKRILRTSQRLFSSIFILLVILVASRVIKAQSSDYSDEYGDYPEGAEVISNRGTQGGDDGDEDGSGSSGGGYISTGEEDGGEDGSESGPLSDYDAMRLVDYLQQLTPDEEELSEAERVEPDYDGDEDDQAASGSRLKETTEDKTTTAGPEWDDEASDQLADLQTASSGHDDKGKSYKKGFKKASGKWKVKKGSKKEAEKYAKKGSEHSDYEKKKKSTEKKLKSDSGLKKSAKVKSEKFKKKTASGSGEAGGKKGEKFLKDKGYKKKGFKSVYHKEEYGDHKSYFDEFRDKKGSNKWKKFDENYKHKEGKKMSGDKKKKYYKEKENLKKKKLDKKSSRKHGHHEKEGKKMKKESYKKAKKESDGSHAFKKGYSKKGY